MFVQVTKSRRNGKVYLTYLVRESFRTAAGPRSRTVCNITALPPPLRQLIADSLAGHRFVAEDKLQLQQALDYGGLAVLVEAWTTLGLDHLFAGIGTPRQRSLLQAVIFSRLLFPCAKLALRERATGTLLAQACGLSGRTLLTLKAHKYFSYEVDAAGVLRWSRKEDVIALERAHDGWYLLHTNLPAAEASAQTVQGHYKNLLEVEEAFCELKSYLRVRPVFHRRPDRVINHVRLCFLSYWLSARLATQWRDCGEPGEVTKILRQLQTIRLGQLHLGDDESDASFVRLTEIPPELNVLLQKLNLLKLFAAPPKWATPKDL